MTDAQDSRFSRLWSHVDAFMAAREMEGFSVAEVWIVAASWAKGREEEDAVDGRMDIDALKDFGR